MTWKALHHPNVSQLLGVTMTENRFVMVSEWANNGNVTEFVKVHTDVNRPELVCTPFCNPALIRYLRSYCCSWEMSPWD